MSADSDKDEPGTNDGSAPAARSRLHELAINLSVMCAMCVVLFIFAELVLRFFAPLQYIVPASDWTPEYGVIAFPSTEIENAKPGVFHHTYTTNSARYRGPLVTSETPGDKVVLLGDSNVFGFGVDDDKTISARMNTHFTGGQVAVNLGNGGWSLPQEVRRYLELGSDLKPKAVVLHMAANDLQDAVYGINWVSYVDDAGVIGLRVAPKNPAGRLRKLLPPDGWAYGLVMRSQIMMRLKGLLNAYVMGVATRSDGTALKRDGAATSEKATEDQVIVLTDTVENERRYMMLLAAFADRLRSDDIRFVFLTDDEDVYGAEKLAAHVGDMVRAGRLEHYPVSRWFVPGREFPKSLQGHQWGDEAADTLAKRLVDILEGSHP
jgi:hypothetical protein